MQNTTQQTVSLQPVEDQRSQWFTYDSPISFDVAAEQIMRVHKEDGVRNDVMTNGLDTWAFGTTDQKTMALARVPYPGRDVGVPLKLRALPYRMLCKQLSVPAPYIRRLPLKLQIACMNYALSHSSHKGMFRLSGNEIRGMVSERYTPVDDQTLFEVIGEVLDRAELRGQAMVRNAAIGKKSLIRLTIPSEAIEVKKNDAIEYGIDITNSELGIGSVSVYPVTYRLVCTNGMKSWVRDNATMRLRHIGDPARLRESLSDLIPVAMAEARGDVDKWKKSVELFIDNALDEIQGLQSFDFSENESNAIGRELLALPNRTQDNIEDLLKGTSTSVFDVANAVTAYARSKSDIDDRTGIEEKAYRYLSNRVAA